MTPRSQTAALTTLVIGFACVISFGMTHSGSSIRGWGTIAILSVAGIAIAGVSVIAWVHGSRRKLHLLRKLSAIVFAGSIITALVPMSFSKYRLRNTVTKLEDTYLVLSKKGPPFPDSKNLVVAPSDYLLWDHGYWVSPDRKSFELFYHSASDSYTLVYPSGSKDGWQWRGCGYLGPK